MRDRLKTYPTREEMQRSHKPTKHTKRAEHGVGTHRHFTVAFSENFLTGVPAADLLATAIRKGRIDLGQVRAKIDDRYDVAWPGGSADRP